VDEGVEKQQFRIGTFNLNNLVLPEVEYYHGESYSAADYRQKVDWTARQLDRMQVDLVGFQEIFQEQALAEVLATTDSAQQHQLVMAEGIGQGPGVALATSFPVLEQRVYVDFPPESWLSVDAEKARIPLTSFSHPVLAVEVELPNGLPCTVFVVHLKSKRPMMFRNVDRSDPVEIAKGQARSLIRRAAEATALRYILMEKLRDRRYPVIVMGDVNDNHTSVTTQLVTGQPPWECWSFRKKVPVWDTLLYQVKDIQARLGYGDHYYTHIHNGHYDSLDHIMVSEEFAPRNRNHIGQVIYVSVYNDHLFDQTLLDDQIERWKSDHGQVVATIALDD
jgi:endonuclease/exonuclease/phosphatase family metal-dependent hydrolase